VKTTSGEVDQDEQDPSIIPEEIKEFIKKAHKEQRESRPDEAWRVTPPAMPDHVAPYKKDEESEELPAMCDGGMVKGYADGGEVSPDDELDRLNKNNMSDLMPQGASLAGEPAIQPQDAPAPLPAAPEARPAQPAAVVSRETTSPTPAPTDADYMDKASKMLGLDQGQQAAFMQMLAKNSQKGQIGAGIAGIGDAIASGGTLGKVNPGALGRTEDIINNNEKTGIEGMQTLRENQGKTVDLQQKLEAQDPNSPLSKYAQKAYGNIGKKIGIDLTHASAALISDVTGKGVDVLAHEAELGLKQAALGLQKEQVEATIGNQQAERGLAKEKERMEADKEILKGSMIPFVGPSHGEKQEALKRLEPGATGSFSPDVTAYAQRHGITPKQAQVTKDKRTGAK
jgi:hypothetical protein